jgi:tetratricopeptide (TPR) repeat protein
MRHKGVFRIILSFIIAFLLTFIAHEVSGQSKINVDSSLKEITLLKDDTFKVNLIFKLLDQMFESYQTDSLLYISLLSKDICENLVEKNKESAQIEAYKLKLAYAYIYCGRYYYYNSISDINKYWYYYKKALVISRENKNPLLTGILLLRIGDVISLINQLELALRCYKQALKIFEGIDDIDWQANTHERIAQITFGFRGLLESNEGLEHRIAALKLYTKISNYRKVAMTSQFLASSYIQRKEPEQAQKYFKTAMNAYQQSGDSLNVAFLFDEWAHADLVFNDTVGALKKYTEGYRMITKFGHSQNRIMNLNNRLSRILIPQNNYESIFKNLDEQFNICLDERDSLGLSKIKSMQAEWYINGLNNKPNHFRKDTSDIRRALLNYSSALDYFPVSAPQFEGAVWSIIRVSEEEHFLSLSAKSGHNTFDHRKSTELFKSKLWKDIANCYSLLGKYDSAYIAIQFSMGIRDTLFSLTNQDRIHSNNMQSTKSKQSAVIDLQKDKIASEMKLQRIFVISLILVSALLIILSFSLYRGYKTNRKLNQAIVTIQETQEKLIRQEQLSFEEKLATQRAEQEMKLLRAQMNPHFIFNALNSIHNCILQKDTMTASSSLTKFSRLVRRILESSREAIVSLESELSTLELYIQLEQMRFNTKFDYKISIEPGIDMNEFSVPPLILQPFVENSIWHGLMPSDKKGIIEIEVKKRGDLLHFSIIDNGIGRQKSADLKAKSEHQHTSHGLAITKERLSMYNKVSNTDTFTIIDLYDTTGLPAGTKVEFDLTIQNYAA